MKVGELLEKMGYKRPRRIWDNNLRDYKSNGTELDWVWEDQSGFISAQDARILSGNLDKELEHYTMAGTFFGVFAYKIRGGMACFVVNKFNQGYELIRMDNWRKEKFAKLKQELATKETKIETYTTPIYDAWVVMEQIDGQ